MPTPQVYTAHQADFGPLQCGGDLDRYPSLLCAMQTTLGWGSPHLLQTCRLLHHKALHRALLNSWHTSEDAGCPVRVGLLAYGGGPSYTGNDQLVLPLYSPLVRPVIGADLSGHSASVWFSLRQDWHRQITWAWPVNASLYKAESILAHPRLFAAAARRR